MKKMKNFSQKTSKSGMFSETRQETILFWASRGKLRINRNQLAHHRAKHLDRHLKKDKLQREHCNECLICLEIHHKTRIFRSNSF